MKSCDKLMCSNILEHITYNDMTLFDGISNNLRFFEYANQKIYFPDGRGYIDFTELLRKMEISYEFLNVKQLSNRYNDAPYIHFKIIDCIIRIYGK